MSGLSKSDPKYRGDVGVSNAKSKPFRLNGGGIFPSSMREVYHMAGLRKISPFIPGGQTGTSSTKLGPKPGYYGRGYGNE